MIEISSLGISTPPVATYPLGRGVIISPASPSQEGSVSVCHLAPHPISSYSSDIPASILPPCSPSTHHSRVAEFSSSEGVTATSTS